MFMDGFLSLFCSKYNLLLNSYSNDWTHFSFIAVFYHISADRFYTLPEVNILWENISFFKNCSVDWISSHFIILLHIGRSYIVYFTGKCIIYFFRNCSNDYFPQWFARSILGSSWILRFMGKYIILFFGLDDFSFDKHFNQSIQGSTWGVHFMGKYIIYFF